MNDKDYGYLCLMKDKLERLWSEDESYRPSVGRKMLVFHGLGIYAEWSVSASVHDENAQPVENWHDMCVGHMMAYLCDCVGLSLNICMIGDKWYCGTTAEKGKHVSAEAYSLLDVLVEFGFSWNKYAKGEQ